MGHRKTIHYLAYYDIPGRCEEREAVLAATNLIDFVSNEIIELGYKVRLISASATRSKSQSFKGDVVHINPYFEVKFFKTIARKSFIHKIASLILVRVLLFFELWKLKKEDTLLVYHATSYPHIVNITKKLRGYKLILYVGEIYSDVSHDIKLRRKEFAVFDCADSYLFATEYLNQIINKAGKPNIEIYGDYLVEEDRRPNKSDGLIHCIYAGTFDRRKGEAQLSVKCAEFLPNNYCVDICGFGTNEDVMEIEELIKKINKTSQCKIRYHGSVRGEEFVRLLQSCDIGLFTPIADAKFNDSDFPSKIFSYLANGLRVVSADVVPVRHSRIGEVLYYYRGNDPRAIADAIIKIDFNNDYDSRVIVERIHKEFRLELEQLLRQ